MSEEPGPVPDLRASDAEREQTVEVLQQAAQDGRLTVEEFEERVHSAYTARTRSELQPLTADLSAEPPLPAGAGPGSWATVREQPGGTSWIVSVLGGHDKKGRWRVGTRCRVISVLGGSEVDLNDAELSGPLTEITVFSLLGGSEIYVPNGVDVQVSDIGLLGGNDVQLGDERPPPGAPTIHLRLVAILGGSEVRRGRRLGRFGRLRERALRRAQQRDLDS